MLFLLNGDGTMTRLDSGRIFQGSNNFTELGVIYPFSGVTLSAAFTLPNGIDTDYTPMPSLEPYTLKGNNCETKVFENLYYTSTRIPSSVTAMQGDVKVTVLATAAAEVTTVDDEGRLTTEEQATQCTSYAATFTVEYAALPIYTVPDDPTEADFQKLVELLTAYQGTITGNVTELQNRMTTAEGNITSLGERVTTAEGEIDDLQERMTAAEGNIEQAQGDISDLQSDKQDKTDNALKTSDKTVVGAINQIYDELTDTSGTGFASRLDTAEAEINVLDSRMDDVEALTAQPLMTDLSVDVATSTATKFYNNGTTAEITLPTGDTAERINFLTSVSFTESQWTEQSDGTYSINFTSAQTGRTNNSYVANLEATSGTAQVITADQLQKNADGSITLQGFTEPFDGRIITVAAGQHGSIFHFGTAVTGTGAQISSDTTLAAAAMIGDAYINTATSEYYKCTAVTSTTSTWEYLGNLQGTAATVSVGMVETLDTGEPATVTNSGTSNAAVLNFGLPKGDTGNGIQSIVYSSTTSDGSFVYTINFTNGGTATFTAPRGPQGAPGATGEGFSIYKTYASVTAMNADAANVPDGKFVMIASTESDPDNAKLYVRTTDGEDAFDFIADLSGATGIQGEAATIQVGTVTTGAAGTQASVINSGTENAAVFDFTIPQGAQGTAATVTVGTTTTGNAGTQASVTNSGTASAATLNFTIPRGADGATFTPAVDTNGNLSWTNNGGLANPETVNIKGAQGEAATVEVGTTTTLAAGSEATVSNSGTSNAAVLNFGIPKGEAATIEVGTVTTGAAGTQASVTNSGTAGAAVLDFIIPQGADGASGVTSVTAGTPTQSDGYTVTPLTFNFEQGNSAIVNVAAQNGASGITIVDLGEVTFVDEQASITLTAEQQTALLAETPPIVTFSGVQDSLGSGKVELSRLYVETTYALYSGSASAQGSTVVVTLILDRNTGIIYVTATSGGLQSTTISVASLSTLADFITQYAAISGTPIIAKAGGYGVGSTGKYIVSPAMLLSTTTVDTAESRTYSMSVNSIICNDGALIISGAVMNVEDFIVHHGIITIIPTQNIAQVTITGSVGYENVDLAQSIFASSFNITVYHQ